MAKNHVKLNVSPEFQKLLKIEAATQGISIIRLTENLAEKKRGKKVGERINSLFDKII